MADQNTQIRLASRPDGKPTSGNFTITQAPMPSPRDGQVLIRTQYLSLDPYMRGRMSDAPSYAPPVTVGGLMVGGTVVVAAASGPVGATAGQLARILGARAVGIAGGEEKVAYLREIGFDAAIDHRAADFKSQLAAATPDGIDVYFENVGGHVWDAVLSRLNGFARVPVCGLVAHYNDTALPPGPNRAGALMSAILRKSLTVRGFIQNEFAGTPLMDEFLAKATAWVQDGSLKYREHIVDGLENAPEAFIGMLDGANFGKPINPGS